MKTIFITSLFLLLSYCICDDLALGVVSNCEFAGSAPASTIYGGLYGVDYSRRFLLFSFITPNETDLSISTLSFVIVNSTTPHANLTATLVLLDNNHLPDTVITSFTETIFVDSERYYNFTHFENYTLLPFQPYGIIFENGDYIPPILGVSGVDVGLCDQPTMTSDKNFTFLDFSQQERSECPDLTACNWTKSGWNSQIQYYTLMIALYTSTRMN